MVRSISSHLNLRVLRIVPVIALSVFIVLTVLQLAELQESFNDGSSTTAVWEPGKVFIADDGEREAFNANCAAALHGCLQDEHKQLHESAQQVLAKAPESLPHDASATKSNVSLLLELVAEIEEQLAATQAAYEDGMDLKRKLTRAMSRAARKSICGPIIPSGLIEAAGHTAGQEFANAVTRGPRPGTEPPLSPSGLKASSEDGPSCPARTRSASDANESGAPDPTSRADVADYASCCSASQKELSSYLAYTPYATCPNDWVFAQWLKFSRRCFCLPRRRCFAATPPPPSHLPPPISSTSPLAATSSIPFPASLFHPDVLQDARVLWVNRSCESFDCLRRATGGSQATGSQATGSQASGSQYLGFCPGCFDLEGERDRWVGVNEGATNNRREGSPRRILRRAGEGGSGGDSTGECQAGSGCDEHPSGEGGTVNVERSTEFSAGGSEYSRRLLQQAADDEASSGNPPLRENDERAHDSHASFNRNLQGLDRLAAVGTGTDGTWSHAHHDAVQQVVRLKPPGALRIGLDINGGTGSFAATLATHNVTVVTSAADWGDGGESEVMGGPPFLEAVASRGLVPLHVPADARQPFFDSTLDLVHVTMAGIGEGREDMEELLYEWDRILRPRGLLWIDIPDIAGGNISFFESVLEPFAFTRHVWNVSRMGREGVENIISGSSWMPIGAHNGSLSCVLEKPCRYMGEKGIMFACTYPS